MHERRKKTLLRLMLHIRWLAQQFAGQTSREPAVGLYFFIPEKNKIFSHETHKEMEITTKFYLVGSKFQTTLNPKFL